MSNFNRITMLTLSVLSASCSLLDFDETTGLQSKDDMYKYYNSIVAITL